MDCVLGRANVQYKYAAGCYIKLFPKGSRISCMYTHIYIYNMTQDIPSITLGTPYLHGDASPSRKGTQSIRFMTWVFLTITPISSLKGALYNPLIIPLYPLGSLGAPLFEKRPLITQTTPGLPWWHQDPAAPLAPSRCDVRHSLKGSSRCCLSPVYP